MSIWEAIIMGIVQGLTEFLPVSSSGHLELASYLFGIEGESNFQFSMALHAGTVLSTLLVFRSEIKRLSTGFFRRGMNDEKVFVFNLIISVVPVAFIGLMFNDEISALFTGNIRLVGIMLLVTAALLAFANYAKPRFRSVTPKSAFIIGIAQALAVLPGLSRSGSTISAGLLLGVKKEEVSKFSFLMALIPIIGANVLELMKTPIGEGVGMLNMAAGFIAAFVTGTLACKWMISLVNRGKLIWFSVYCVVVGVVSIVASF